MSEDVTERRIERRMLDHAEQSISISRGWIGVIGFAFTEEKRAAWIQKLTDIEVEIHEKWTKMGRDRDL